MTWFGVMSGLVPRGKIGQFREQEHHRKRGCHRANPDLPTIHEGRVSPPPLVGNGLSPRSATGS